MAKKKSTLKECQKEITELLKKKKTFSKDLEVQAEIVGTQLWLYRRMVETAETADVFVPGAGGQKVINTIFEQIRRYSDDLRKGLASLQLNKDKVTGSALKKDTDDKKKNEIGGFVSGLNEAFK